MLMTPELWQQIKEMERGIDAGGPGGLVEVTISFNAGVAMAAHEADLLDLGAIVKAKGRRFWRVEMSARKVPQLCALGIAALVSPAEIHRHRPVIRAWLASSALAVLVALVGVVYLGQDTVNKGPDPGESAREQPAKQKTISPADRLYQDGLEAYKAGDKVLALELWQSLLAKHPEDLVARRSMGWLLYEMGAKNSAKEQFVEVLRHAPSDAESISAMEVIGSGREGRRPGARSDVQGSEESGN